MFVVVVAKGPGFYSRADFSALILKFSLNIEKFVFIDDYSIHFDVVDLFSFNLY